MAGASSPAPLKVGTLMESVRHVRRCSVCVAHDAATQLLSRTCEGCRQRRGSWHPARCTPVWHACPRSSAANKAAMLVATTGKLASAAAHSHLAVVVDRCGCNGSCINVAPDVVNSMCAAKHQNACMNTPGRTKHPQHRCVAMQLPWCGPLNACHAHVELPCQIWLRVSGWLCQLCRGMSVVPFNGHSSGPCIAAHLAAVSAVPGFCKF